MVKSKLEILQTVSGVLLISNNKPVRALVSTLILTEENWCRGLFQWLSTVWCRLSSGQSQKSTRRRGDLLRLLQKSINEFRDGVSFLPEVSVKACLQPNNYISMVELRGNQNLLAIVAKVPVILHNPFDFGSFLSKMWPVLNANPNPLADGCTSSTDRPKNEICQVLSYFYARHVWMTLAIGKFFMWWFPSYFVKSYLIVKGKSCCFCSHVFSRVWEW